MIYGFTDSDYLLKLAREESESRLVSYVPFKLNENTLQQLIEKHDFVVLSADIFYFNNSYHDYHFCCIGKQEGEYRLFEPKSGSEKEVTYKEISDIIQSISENLGDAILAFCV
jgi:hypothetical protein